jgi:DNA-binding transcriptional MerR regulator
MQKLYYSISEVSEMIDEEQHILRYWEKEFDQLCPKKNRAGNRIYSDKDINTLKIIKKLLREEKLSLKGAKENIEKININNLEDNLFSNSNSTENSLWLDNSASPEVPEDSLIIRKNDLRKIHSLILEMRDLLVKI